MVIRSIAADPRLHRLRTRLAGAHRVVHVSGLWGSSAPMVCASVIERTRRTVLYVTAHLEEADRTREDLELFLGRSCDLFPAWETLPGEGAASGEIDAERLRLCADLHRAASEAESPTEARVLLAPVQALMQPVPAPEALEADTLRVGVGAVSGAATSPQALLTWAVDRGFERLELVESPGDVAVRGDIVDLFAPGATSPFRIQFFGDEIESIRRFDVSTQRSA